MDRFNIQACALEAIGWLVAEKPDAKVGIEQGGEANLYRVDVVDGDEREGSVSRYFVVVGVGPRPDGTHGAIATVAPR